MKTIIQETERPIESIFWPNEFTLTRGEGKIEAIVAYREEDGSIWIAVWENGKIASRYNTRHIDGIHYAD